MKVIFLDIDGVLNCTRSCIALDGYANYHKLDRFDDVAVGLVRNICDKTGCKIILSSTWRLFKGWEDLHSILNLPIIDRTPRLLERERGYEIKQYLEEHSEIKKYCIIDDDSDMLEEQLNNFVHTDYNEGFLYKDYLKVLEILQKG